LSGIGPSPAARATDIPSIPPIQTPDLGPASAPVDVGRTAEEGSIPARDRATPETTCVACTGAGAGRPQSCDV